MDKKTRIRLGLERSVFQQIHEDLFKNTTEYDYYLLGISQGMFSIYEMFSKIEPQNVQLNLHNITEIINQFASSNEDIKKYFDKFITELKELEKKDE